MYNIVASKKVIEGQEISLLHHLKDFWIVIATDENPDGIKNVEDNFFAVDETWLYSRVPGLKGKLDQPVDTTININMATGEININKKHLHLGIPTHSARATRQANADFSIFKWVFHYKKRYFKALLVTLALLAGALLIGWFFYVPMVLHLAYEVLSTLKERDMFKSGALGPAIVIDEKNQKIATFTDLSLGMGKYPVIRIKKVELPEKYRKVGTRIPVAGAYQNTEKYTHWNYYNPLPLPTGVTDAAVIEEKLNAIPTIEWIKLRTEISKFATVPLEGYYPIDIDNSAWKGVDIPAVKWMQFSEEK